MKLPALPALAACITLATATAFSGAQDTSTAKQGLASLDPQKVMTELANMGLKTLLQRDFELHHVPPDQQRGIITLIALQQLSNPSAHLSATQRRDLITKICNGITDALPTISDPRLLMQQATVLIKSGVDPDVNALEYFGTNPKTQKQLYPVVETVRKILDRAADAATTKATQLANQMTSPDQNQLADQWQQMTNMKVSAQYTSNMEGYDQALALPKGDSKRKTIADAAIKFLKQYDTKDSGVQAAVRNRIAKLNLVKGDYSASEKIFATVAKNPGAQIKPPPNAAQQYAAIYFGVVARIEAGDLSQAEHGMISLDAWQKQNLNGAQQKGAAAAYTMLRYRILTARADKTHNQGQKKKYNNQAIALLIGLIKDRPDLRTVVFEQVLNRLPAHPDIAKLDPLLLLALQQQGEDEFLKPQNQKIDTAIMNRAISATRQIIKSQGHDNIDAKTAANSANVLPYLLMREGNNKEAAAAFMDFARKFPNNLKNANDALDHATVIIGQLRRSDPQDQQTRKLYDRFLPIAINPPFNRKQFAFGYGLLLERQQKYAQAITYLKQVKPDDPRVLSAHFYEMFALKQELGNPHKKFGAAQRQIMAAQIQTLADQVNTEASKKLASVTTSDDKNRYDSMLVSTALIAADLSLHEQNNPKRTLKLLDGFEQKVAGLPNAQNQLGEALYLRVNAYMDLRETSKATDTLVKLLQTKPGGQGPALVFDLLKKLDAQLTLAKEQNHTAEVRQLAQNRAALSGFLVTWAENNQNPKIKALASKYKAFDAATQQMAAELNNNPAARKAGLEVARKRYVELYNPANPDSTVELGLGIVSYELGNYADAMKYLSPLVVNKKLGGATETITKNGVQQTVENTQYWEANLRLMQSTANIAKAKPQDAAAQQNLGEVKTYLKQLYVEWPKTIGGTEYHKQYEDLRKEIIPDFQFEPVEPTTAPAAA